MTYTYLVTNKTTGETELIEASSPSIAIADAADKVFSAERVQGGALAILSKSMTVRKVTGTRNPTPAPAPAPAGEAPPAGDPPPDGKTADKPGTGDKTGK